MPVICNVIHCNKPAVLKRPKTGDPLCKECFFYAFESEIHVTIIGSELFKRGDKVAIGASGGKDSTVLAYILKLLNEKYDYGLDLFLLSIDEGITGYRDDSLETVKQNKIDYQLPLKILSYKDLYGWTMDEIVAQIGRKNNCTFCGVFRRQALDRGAALLGADMIVTGHNADDIAETVIMNVLRGDIARLARCTKIVTEGEGTIPRCKPLKYAYEKEIVMYAHYKNLVYFSTECMYAPNAYRGHTREYIKEIERVRPTCILDIIHSGETVQFKKNVKFPERRTCTRCGFIASQEICKACVLLEGLNRGMPKLGITKSNKARRVMGLKVDDGSENKGKKPEKPIYESKRKMRRDMRKKKACGENCGDSGCGSKNPQPCTSTADIDPFMLTPDENFEEKLLQENEKPNVSNDLLESNEKELQNEASGVSSGLAKPKIKPDEEIAQGCGGLDDWASEALPTGLSSDDEEIIEIKEKKEKVVCKCPQELKKKAKDSPINTDTETEDEDMSGGMFNIQLFKALASAYNPDLIEALKEHESPEEFKKIEDIHRKIRENDKKVEQEFLELRKMFENKEKNTEEEQSSTSTAERLPWLQRETIDEALSSTSETKESESCSGNQAQENVEVKSKDDLEDVNEFSEELLSELLKMTINEEINTEEGQPSTSITERLPWLQRETADEALSFLSATKESESCTENEAPEHLNVKQSSEDEPTIVKAKAKKKQPSLMLPEMIHKAPNKLDF